MVVYEENVNAGKCLQSLKEYFPTTEVLDNGSLRIKGPGDWIVLVEDNGPRITLTARKKREFDGVLTVYSSWEGGEASWRAVLNDEDLNDVQLTYCFSSEDPSRNQIVIDKVYEIMFWAHLFEGKMADFNAPRKIIPSAEDLARLARRELLTQEQKGTIVGQDRALLAALRSGISEEVAS
jgi:hypothetical protein